MLMCGIGLSILSYAESGKETPQDITYDFTPPAPRVQTALEASAKSAGCITCHTDSDQKTMHEVSAVVLGCTDCHGGDPNIKIDAGLIEQTPEYTSLRDQAHVQPRYPETWHYPSSANPKRSYTLPVSYTHLTLPTKA